MSNGVFLSALQLNAGLQLNCNQVRDVWICQYGKYILQIIYSYRAIYKSTESVMYEVELTVNSNV